MKVRVTGRISWWIRLLYLHPSRWWISWTPDRISSPTYSGKSLTDHNPSRETGYTGVDLPACVTHFSHLSLFRVNACSIDWSLRPNSSRRSHWGNPHYYLFTVPEQKEPLAISPFILIFPEFPPFVTISDTTLISSCTVSLADITGESLCK